MKKIPAQTGLRKVITSLMKVLGPKVKMRMGLFNEAVEVKVNSVRLKVFFHLMKMMLEMKKLSQAGGKMEKFQLPKVTAIY